MKKSLLLIVIGIAAVLLGVTISVAQDVENIPTDPNKPLIIGVEEFKPNVIKDMNKLGFTGFDINLWESIAGKLGWKYQYKEVEFNSIFDKLVSGELDVGICGITINQEREEIIDFSHPYYDSGLGIMVKGEMKKPSVLPLIFKRLFSLEILKVLGMLFACLLIFGIFLWAAERGRDAISDKAWPGILEAIWCSWAIMTTIGFGDIAPKRILGRLLSVPIFIFGCMIVGIVSAPFVSAFAVRDIQEVQSKIKSPDDLRDKLVATASGTTSETTLNNLGANVVTVAKIEEGYVKLLNDEVDAVVYDIPALKYYANGEGKGKVVLVGGIFESQKYGFALQPGSKLREPINRELLELKENGKNGEKSTYEKIYEKYFGEM
jgi:ABC-type amino acid transport substrate-binding protein